MTKLVFVKRGCGNIVSSFFIREVYILLYERSVKIMAIDYNKPLRMEYEIEGISNEIEGMLASKILFEIYNIAADIANNGGIAEFNSEWNVKHPDGVYEQEEYEAAYKHYFKDIADTISDMTKAGNVTYKLRENEPILINFSEGYFKIHGYKEVYA